MGAFDDIEAKGSSSPTRFSMLGRGIGEARRKFFLFALLAFFLLLTFVAFRRQDKIKDIVDQSFHRSNATAAVSKPDLKPDSKSDPKSDPKSDSKLQSEQSKSRLKPETSSSYGQGPVLATANGDRYLAKSSLNDIHNTSLGFEKVYVLNVPGRSDKLDMMKLTSSLTDFNFDIIEGINGKDVPKKALSGVWKDSPGVNGIIGCWRGHMNFAATVVKNRHATALIMEDDADWDISFKNQLELIALGSQTLLDNPKGITPHSPYGEGWDLIWLGHCASQPTPGDNRRFLMKNDPTVTPYTHRTNYGGIPDMSPYDNSTRIMYFTMGSTCTYSYALSYHGAQKILKWLSMDIYSGPVDFGLHDMCEKKERGFKCIGVFPQIIADHKPAGAGNKDTDIGDGGSNIREKGFSYNIVHSTRMNVDVLIDGKMDKVQAQWPEDAPNPPLKGPVITDFKNEELPPRPEGTW